jgi:hypothetical protein
MQIQDGEGGLTAHDFADEAGLRVQRGVSRPGLTAAIGGSNLQRLAAVIHQHERRGLHPEKSHGAPHHAPEDFVELEAGGDVVTDLDERAQLRFLPQGVAVQRIVVQRVCRDIRQGLQERLLVVPRPRL